MGKNYTTILGNLSQTMF